MINKQMYCDYCGDRTTAFDKLTIESPEGTLLLELCRKCSSELKALYLEKQNIVVTDLREPEANIQKRVTPWSK